MAREPAPWVQLVQLAHGLIGALLVPLGAVFVIAHVLHVFGVGLRGARNVPWILIAGLVFVVVLAHPGGSPVSVLDGEQRAVANQRGQLASFVLVAYVAWVAFRAVRRGMQASAPSGLLLAVVAVVMTVSGFLTIGGIAAPNLWRAHVASAVGLALVGAVHALGARRRRARGLAAVERRFAWRAPLLRAGVPAALGALAVTVWMLAYGLPRVEPLTVDREALVPVDRDVATLVPAACEGCHVSVSATWRISTHAFAARNPVFTALVRRLAEARGAAAVAGCLQCHAPHAPDPRRAELEAVLASDGYAAGVQCVTCHRMEAGPNPGGLPIAVTPLANDTFLFLSEHTGELASGIRRSPPNLASALFAGRISLHRAQFRPALAAPASCRPCHRQTLAEATGGRLDHVVQDQYGSWEGSAAARDRIECAACHMPSFESSEGYTVRDHRFLGGGTYVARVAGGASGERDVVTHLQGGAPAPAGARTAVGWRTEVEPLLTIAARLEVRGDGKRVLVIETRNSGRVGHAFAEGPTDLTQTWLAVRIASAEGRVLVERSRRARGRGAPRHAALRRRRCADHRPPPVGGRARRGARPHPGAGGAHRRARAARGHRRRRARGLARVELPTPRARAGARPDRRRAGGGADREDRVPRRHALGARLEPHRGGPERRVAARLLGQHQRARPVGGERHATEPRLADRGAALEEEVGVRALDALDHAAHGGARVARRAAVDRHAAAEPREHLARALGGDRVELVAAGIAVVVGAAREARREVGAAGRREHQPRADQGAAPARAQRLEQPAPGEGARRHTRDRADRPTREHHRRQREEHEHRRHPAGQGRCSEHVARGEQRQDAEDYRAARACAAHGAPQPRSAVYRAHGGAPSAAPAASAGASAAASASAITSWPRAVRCTSSMNRNSSRCAIRSGAGSTSSTPFSLAKLVSTA
ncbi:MAG: hypothetical protein IPK07_12395 [Deltaproteobacteria bacterium]|nr:hypothetical protein [Deltaproteobacteria bacterium]